jgi:hypothetical protein
MTVPTNVAPDDARHDYITRVYKMRRDELFAELMRVHTEANRLVNDAVAAEREACAQVCEDYVQQMDSEYRELGNEIAGIIQARGKQERQQ